MGLFIYNFIRVIFCTICFPVFIIKNSFFLKRIFSYKKLVKNSKETIWFHMSSVGELNLSEPLIKKVLNERSENILITLFTDTGFENAKNKFGNSERVEIIFFPLDFRFAIKNILKLKKIKLLVVIETEIWPNLISMAAKKAKVMVVNGRISDKSIKSYMRLKWLLKGVLKKVERVLMQTEEDCSRAEKIGFKYENIKKMGNLKFDVEYGDYSEEELKSIRDNFGSEKKILVAGSTHPGEEELAVNFVKANSGWAAYIVPRHIERCGEIESKIAADTSYRLYSDSQKRECDIIIVDKMGILRALYAAADGVFVGGSYANVGGHSLLEPLYYGKLPVFGENIQNVKEIASIIEQRGIGYKIKNYLEFEEAVLKSSSEKNKKELISIFLNENRGALECVMKNIVDII